jgi:hypothetical protein
MPPGKLAVASCAAAILLCGCGVVKPPQGRGRIDDARVNNPNRLACMKAAHLPVQLVGKTGIQIGPLPGGPSIWFAPNAGAAEGDQIEGQVQGAEVIGAALLYPHDGSHSELRAIESCLDEGVTA